jgi:dTDP-4-amino-4,6-dideoxygalactose transaminase
MLMAQSMGLGRDARPELRQLLLRRYQADGCLLCARGTHALQIALSALASDATAGRPVLLPAFTCYEVATAAVGARVPVALYDVDPLTLEPDWDSVVAASHHGAAALVVAPLFGMPIDWVAARRMAERIQVPLIADVAQAQGTIWEDAPAGAAADLIVLSFGRGKGWTGMGGGALLWRGPSRSLEGVERSGWRADSVPLTREISTAAGASSQFLLARSTFYGLPAAIPFLHLGETIYHEPTQPRPITRSSASLLLLNEEIAAREVSRRRSNAEQYTRLLGRVGAGVTAVPGARLDGSSGALRYPVRVRGGWSAIRATAAPDLGAAATYPTTLEDVPALKLLLQPRAERFVGAQLLVRELVTLPTHSQTNEAERRRLVELIAIENKRLDGGMHA